MSPVFTSEASFLTRHLAEPDTTYRKYKESAHMALIDNPISQPSMDIYPIWTPIITAEAKNIELGPV
jgi:hypothetical protein